MPRWPMSNGKRAGGCSSWSLTLLLVLLATMAALRVDAQTANSPQISPDSANPYLVEQRQIGDPRPRFELRFGEPQKTCTSWRLEATGQADGYAVLDVKEPADKKVILDIQSETKSMRFVIGDVACNYRITIERNK